MKLADFILSNMENILQEWQDYASTLQPQEHMNQEALRDHAQEMLESIAKDLTTPQTSIEEKNKSKGQSNPLDPPSEKIDQTAKEHGLSRFGSKFTIKDLAAEYRALRASVLGLWGECAETAKQTNINDVIRFGEGIDQALAVSITAYTLQNNQQIRLFEAILSSSPDHSYILDLDGRFLYANQSLAERLNLSALQITGKNFFDLGFTAATELHQQVQKVIQTRMMLRGETAYESGLGKYGYFEYIFTPVINPDGRVEAVAGTERDITERKATNDEVWHTANYDLLTNLPNRRLFRNRLEEEIKHSERTGTPFALLFIDLDRFKEANDQLGHDGGDQLLKQVADRIRSCIREKDTVARMGGDEFTVILTEFKQLKNIDLVTNKILKELANVFYISQERIDISGSIGITIYPQDASTSELLLSNADQAMYIAKNAGRNQLSFFTPDLHETIRLRHKLIADLRVALPQQQLVVFYQPILELSNEHIHKAEALLRWQHPELGLLLPKDFIHLAEETGIINEMEDWVFTEVALLSKKFQSLLAKPFQISINKSIVQLMSTTHSMNWAAHIKQVGIKGSSILVEIIEDGLINATALSNAKLQDLQQAGIELAIDDFGTGFSSMAYMHKFDINYLKIDQSLIGTILTNVNSQTIAETTIILAHKLGLKVIAEGVETLEQKDWLKTAGVDYAQGFLFSEPVPADQFIKLLQNESSE